MKKRFFWGLIFSSTMYLFYSGISNSVFSQSPPMFSMLGAILCALFLALTFKSNDTQKLKNQLNPYLLSFSFLLFYFVFIERISDNQTEELLNSGITTDGKVIGKSIRRIRNSTIYEVSVVYKDSKGNDHKVSENVSDVEYDALEKDINIPIIYSPTNPLIIKYLLSENDFNKLKKKKIRFLNPDDLYSISKVISNDDSIKNILDNISSGWISIQKNSKKEWQNIINHESIFISDSVYVNYSTTDVNEIFKVKKNLEGYFLSFGLKRNTQLTSKKTTTVIYEGKDYVIASEPFDEILLAIAFVLIKKK